MSSFADAGVTDVVLSPGSRSTPFMIAAARETRFRCHDVIDERAAAFFALGQARVTGRPSLLLCTSGSAAAHYFPAIVEAEAAFVPMLVLTADRPIELQHCAAAQTMDQVKLYGEHVRHFVDLGMPDASLGSLTSLRRIAAQCFFRATYPTPGAVHINARARKPLEPVLPVSAADEALRSTVGALLGTPIVLAATPRLAVNAAAITSVAKRCASTTRGLIVCGPAAISQAEDRSAIFALAAATGFPLLGEASSQMRFTASPPPGVVMCDAFDVLLRSRGFREQHVPDVVIQIGAASPTSSAWEPYVAQHAQTNHVVIARHGWNDPASRASTLLVGDVGEIARALAAELSTGNPDPSAWAKKFASANKLAWHSVEAELAAQRGLTEGEVARTLVANLPAESTLVIGNSLPLRALDTFAGHGAVRARVISQRGVNGIDGFLAGAAGSATALPGAMTLLIGDVTFLHDLTSLFLLRRGGDPFVVVVVQNYGGRIFEQLPLATLPGLEKGVLEHVTTPHALDFSHAARLFGHAYERVDSRAALKDALAAAYGRGGSTLVEAIVPPHDGAEQNRRVWRSVDAKLVELTADPNRVA